MNGQIGTDPLSLAAKIARLVEERGWNQEDFARHSGLNRQTVRQILHHDGTRKLRNGTISRCARALGIPIGDLRELPLERLLLRSRTLPAGDGEEVIRHLYELATQPELRAWAERNPQRAAQLTPGELDEILSVQGTGGPLTSFGVERYVELLERKRRLIEQVHAIAGTEYLEVLEKLLSLIYDKVQPYRDRS
jgi:transcriptional regulator with XRE-family HTH domain